MKKSFTSSWYALNHTSPVSWRLKTHTSCPVLIRLRFFHLFSGCSNHGAHGLEVILKLLSESCWDSIIGDFLDRSRFIVDNYIVVLVYSFFRSSCLYRVGEGIWLSVGSQCKWVVSMQPQIVLIAILSSDEDCSTTPACSTQPHSRQDWVRF